MYMFGVCTFVNGNTAVVRTTPSAMGGHNSSCSNSNGDSMV